MFVGCVNFHPDCGSIPYPVMGTTGDHCRYSKALVTPCEGAIAIGGLSVPRPSLYSCAESFAAPASL